MLIFFISLRHFQHSVNRNLPPAIGEIEMVLLFVCSSSVFCCRLQPFLTARPNKFLIFFFVLAHSFFHCAGAAVVGVILCMCNDRMRIYVFYDSGEIIK